MILDGKAPTGRIQDTWDKHRFEMKQVNPANKRKYKVLVVGTGLAGVEARVPCRRAPARGTSARVS